MTAFKRLGGVGDVTDVVCNHFLASLWGPYILSRFRDHHNYEQAEKSLMRSGPGFWSRYLSNRCDVTTPTSGFLIQGDDVISTQLSEFRETQPRSNGHH